MDVLVRMDVTGKMEDDLWYTRGRADPKWLGAGKMARHEIRMGCSHKSRVAPMGQSQ